jgi:3-hydroxyacyl-CoA dehydrogenase/enoyl-CoA hydratase/3-hydroxybutyryl-CoA epimerase
MGGDIAAWCALRGLTVTLQDQSAERIAPAIGRAAKLFSERLKDARRARDASDRLIPDVNGDGIARADVIIEAIFENVEAKRALFAELEKKARPTRSSRPTRRRSRSRRSPPRWPTRRAWSACTSSTRCAA